MALTSEQQALKDQATAGKHQRFLQDLERLSSDMGKVFEAARSVLLYYSINPDIASLTDEDLADLAKHYDAAKLQAAIDALLDIQDTASLPDKLWTAKILGVY